LALSAAVQARHHRPQLFDLLLLRAHLLLQFAVVPGQPLQPHLDGINRSLAGRKARGAQTQTKAPAKMS
jgi:hypothetical protein